MLRNLINEVLPEKLIEIDAPGMVEVVLNRKGEDLQVHLVNHYREKSLGDAISIAEKVISVHDIGVRVKTEETPKFIKLMPEDQQLPFEVKNGYAEFVVPRLHIYSIALIDM